MPRKSSHHHPMSAFMGRPFANVRGMNRAVAKRLAALGVHDVEQLVAMAAVPGLSRHLSKALKISPAQVDSLVDVARSQIPMPLAAILSYPAVELHALGALMPNARSRRVERSLMLRAPVRGAASLPSTVNHAAAMNDVRSQGQRGTCVSFGATAMREYFDISHGRRLDFSEQFLYEEIKRIDGHAAECGTWLTYAVTVLRNVGECLEPIWGYNPNLPCNGNGTEPANARSNAANYKTQPSMLPAKNVTAIKTAIAADQTVAFCIPVYDSWYRSADTTRTGRITMRVGNEPRVGGHCMCFVGYQDNASSPGGGYFILRNSWGRSWGSQCPYGQGNGTIPYQYITNDATEAATIPKA